VLGTLADLGYGVGWRVLDSRFFGVPQRRRRVYIVGAIAESDPRAAAERASEVLAVGSRCKRHPATSGEAREDVAVASLSGLGSGGPDDNDAQAGRVISHALTSEGHDASEDGTGRGTPIVAETLRSHPRPGSNSNGNLVTAFHALQDPISDSHVAPAWGKDNKNGSASIGVSDATGVRRLTPTECERLQGLPDGWTQLGSTPDSRRYSALGDAVTATVGEWIGRRLACA
jgi:DNA (cytosine-5)-methyltransferase 1